MAVSGGDDGGEKTAAPKAVEARIVSEEKLEGTELEVTEEGGSVLVR